MNISTLQSLIDRTSNEIALYERCYEYFHYDKRIVAEYRRKLKVVRKIQKELKQEIAEEIEYRRCIRIGIDYEKLVKEF